MRCAALFCAGAGAALLALELALRLLPVSAGLYLTQEIGHRPLHTYEPHLSFTYSMGWEMRDVRHGRTNNYGQLAPFDYVPGSRPVIVVGDSYIESQMNDYGDTLQGVLGPMLGAAESVYGLGVSGLSMADYLAFARDAAEFTPRAAVFLLVDGDIAGSLIDQPGYYHFNRTPGGLEVTLHPRKPHPWFTRLRHSVGDLYLFRYVTQNLRFTPPSLGSLLRDAQAQPLAAPDATVEYAAVDRFLTALPRQSGIRPQCVAFLVDADRFGLYDPRHPTPPADLPEAKAYFLRRAAELGYRVADLEPMYRAHFRLHRRHFDYFPVDRHLNALGHRLAAEQAYALFREQEGACLS